MRPWNEFRVTKNGLRHSLRGAGVCHYLITLNMPGMFLLTSQSLKRKNCILNLSISHWRIHFDFNLTLTREILIISSPRRGEDWGEGALTVVMFMPRLIKSDKRNQQPLHTIRNCVAIYFCVISKRSEKSDLQKQVILSEAKDLLVQERSLTRFGTMLHIGFLTKPVLSQILQSLRSFRMTERRVRNDIFSHYDTVSY